MNSERPLANAYASLADFGGVSLYATRDALRAIAKSVRQGWPEETGLASPPVDVVEIGPIRAFGIFATADGPIVLRMDGQAILIEGGIDARQMLAATLENLPASPQTAGPVRRHVDLECFPGHGFLGERSTWMTVILLSAPIP